MNLNFPGHHQEIEINGDNVTIKTYTPIRCRCCDTIIDCKITVTTITKKEYKDMCKKRYEIEKEIFNN